MPAKKTTARRKSLPPALQLLAKDHKMVDDMFRRYERLGEEDDAEKGELIASICGALTAHATLEEELFYPELRQALAEDGTELLDEATVEHETVKRLVSELEDAEAGDPMVDARMKVLAEYVKHHVKEEEKEIFAQAKKTKSIDLEELAERMTERKSELERELGIEGNGEETDGSGSRGRGRMSVQHAKRR
jgi:hemerythrin-like domain-containing protein